jgi:hypothetical protein
VNLIRRISLRDLQLPFILSLPNCLLLIPLALAFARFDGAWLFIVVTVFHIRQLILEPIRLQSKRIAHHYGVVEAVVEGAGAKKVHSNTYRPQ